MECNKILKDWRASKGAPDRGSLVARVFSARGMSQGSVSEALSGVGTGAEAELPTENRLLRI